MSKGMKPDIEGLMEQINKYVESVCEARQKAGEVYEDAKMYQLTDIQIEAFKATEFLYKKIEGIEASLIEKEAVKQKIIDEMMDDYGFAMNDAEDADEHKELALDYVKEIEQMIEELEDDETDDEANDEAADDAADECEEAEKELEEINIKTVADRKKIYILRTSVVNHNKEAVDNRNKIFKYSKPNAEKKLKEAKSQAGKLSALEKIYSEVVGLEKILLIN
jgi:TATA-binding protein-associated factor Taf7